MAIVNNKIVSAEEKNIIISARIIGEIGKILSENRGDEEILISTGDKEATFVIGKTKIISRLLEGEFIKYQDIVPKESKTQVFADKLLLSESVERASIIAREGKNSFIRLKIADGLITLSSKADEGTMVETLPVEVVGEELEIGFNARFMSDMLKAINDERIKMEFNTGISPCLIKPIEGESFSYLILPVRLSTGNV
jgi:DNA polymerase-3 subunit beta